jgi:hypothetical protein
VSGDIFIRSQVPVCMFGRTQILYAAAFIDSRIRKVWIEDEAWCFECSEKLPQELIDQGISQLVERYGEVELPDPVPVFTLSSQGLKKKNIPDIDPEAFCPISSGLFVLKPPFSDLMRFLDWTILRRFAKPFNASDELYPNVIPLEKLAATQHLRSFPEHLHFISHLREDLNVLEQFASRARLEDGQVQPDYEELEKSSLAHNPSTCYHCYAVREGHRLNDDEVATGITRCHRYESSNHNEPGRLMEFSLREVMFIGSAEFVRETRETTLEMIKQWATDWQIFGELLPANDPFFTNDYEAKAVHQHRLAMKYEYRAELSGPQDTLAVLSSNLHSATFGKAFDIRVRNMRANTGCLGFGLERLAIVIASQHGVNAEEWPLGLKSDWLDWLATDALSG